MHYFKSAHKLLNIQGVSEKDSEGMAEHRNNKNVYINKWIIDGEGRAARTYPRYRLHWANIIYLVGLRFRNGLGIKYRLKDLTRLKLVSRFFLLIAPWLGGMVTNSFRFGGCRLLVLYRPWTNDPVIRMNTHRFLTHLKIDCS